MRRSRPGTTLAKGAKGAEKAQKARPKPRLTGRAAILVLVVAVLAVSYASSLRAYLQQRSHIDDLQSQIQQRQQSIGSLETEKASWSDPAYIEMRARLLGYVKPGEVPYQVQKDGTALDVASTLGDPSAIDPTTPPAWWDSAWSSMQLAGHPPTKADPVPQTLIDGSGSGR